MKKISIITINDNGNFGNRLQNYALQKILQMHEFEVETFEIFGDGNNIIYKLKCYIKRVIEKRYINFMKFNKKIRKSQIKINLKKENKIKDSKADFFVTGSDQVWNPNIGRLTEIDLLKFASNEKRIAYAASFGLSVLPEQYHSLLKEELSKFKAISVREDAGKKIIEDVVGRTDVEVLIDPTMLLTAEDWDKVSKRPKHLKTEKYILNYFLGDLSKEREEEINRIAKENNCEVINILDKNSKFYESGPSEFLFLEKNAFLICTDSFHSSVFAILYNRPFVIFNREGNGQGMNSRIETLLSKFKLKNREYNNKNITSENLNHDYTEAYKILEKERKKSKEFLRKALDIKE